MQRDKAVREGSPKCLAAAAADGKRPSGVVHGLAILAPLFLASGWVTK